MNINLFIQVNNFFVNGNRKDDSIEILTSKINVTYNNIKNSIDIEGHTENIFLIELISNCQELHRSCVEKSRTNKSFYDSILDKLFASILLLIDNMEITEKLKDKFLNIAENIIEDRYRMNYHDINNEVLFYYWILKWGLVRKKTPILDFFIGQPEQNKETYSEPSSEEIDVFYEKNRQKIYEILLSHSGEYEIKNPLDNWEISQFYISYRKILNHKKNMIRLIGRT
ncbi:hypothetical protein [Novacetimonas pomaceti]|uniref:hypothetical protein n=1 Tax=Novacetimonas pomaceti TaxID=2021998 RepID=UPI001057F162|nr:hypothetical protein [Novacetimonas pomaceti]